MKLAMLQKSLDKVANAGRAQETFEIEGIKVTLQPLSSDERMRIDEALADLDEEAPVSIWLKEQILRSLSFSIVGIGDDRFEGPTLEDEQGQNVLVTEVLYDTLKQAGDNWIQVVFKKYTELEKHAAEKATEGVEFDEEDPEVEIEELKSRIRALENEHDLPPTLFTDPLHEARKEANGDDLKDLIFTSQEEEEKTEREEHEEEEEEAPAPQYVNEEGSPLEEEELRIAQENDRLLAKRQEANEASNRLTRFKSPNH